MSDSQEKRLSKLQVLVTDTELKDIDDWRFENRADNRSSAVRELIALGLRYSEKHSDDAAEVLKALKAE